MKNNICKFKIKVLSFLGCAALLVSCIDDNVNMPNSSPTPGQVTGDYYDVGSLLMSLQNSVIEVEQNAYQFNENLTGHPYGRYMSITNDGWNDANFSIFNAPMNWLNSVFNDQFTRVYSSWFKLHEKYRSDTENIAWAWTEILRVAAMHRATDMYGPIPYSEIKKNDGKIKVGYDDQQAVYKGLFEDLNKSIAVLTAYVNSGGNSEVSALSQYDLVYKGDFSKWVKFANSLKLRMAMRIVYVDPADGRKYAEEAINHPIGVITSNADNAFIAVEKNPIAVIYGPYEDTRMCADIMTYLKGFEDPRLPKYAKKTKDGKYTGLRTGITIKNKAWAITNFSEPNVGDVDPLMWMCAAEVTFLRAEGAIWKWSVAGTAEAFYNEGVRLSFEQWGIGSATSYLADNTKTQAVYTDDADNGSSPVSTITIKWNESGNFEEKQERILTQKWIAMFPLGHEAWAENRRTGYPRFYPVVINKNPDGSLNKRLASRIPYGPDESFNNKDNYNKALGLLGGGDTYSVRLWWDKKTNKPNW